MVDQNTMFGGMLTTLGAAKKTNCDALGIPWEPKYMLIGDGGGADPVPSPTQTKLVNQVYRAQLNQLRVSPTDSNVLIAELVLPADIGGWWMRELALEDKDGVFSAVGNMPPVTSLSCRRILVATRSCGCTSSPAARRTFS